MRVCTFFAVATAFAGAGDIALAQDPAAAPPVSPAGSCALPGPPPPATLRPSPPGPKPKLPSCVDPRTMMGHCKAGVLQSFNAQVNAYNAQTQLRSAAASYYIDALNSWTRSTAAYASCEVDHINAENAASQ